MTDPRNVKPPEVTVHPPGTTDEEFRRRYYAEREQGPEWQGWTWARSGRSFPWLGVLLVLIGVALLVQYVVPSVSVGTLVLLAIGLAFLAGWVFGRSFFSMVPGVLLVALGVGELIEDLAVFGPPGEDVPGLASAALAIGFLIIWGLAAATKRGWMWPLWGAGIFGLIGVVQLSGRIAGIPELGFVWPVVIIVIGVVLLMSARRQRV